MADTLDVKPANLYAWFQSAAQRYSFIKKVGEAHYSAVGTIPSQDLEIPDRRGARETSGSRKASRGNNSGSGMRRGQLSEQILELLGNAGSAGIRVKDIANTLNMKDKNIFVWFATTGKKNPSIEKVAEAQYRLRK
jgi:hypothetical protein